jgi:hypothetical protein
MAQVNNPRQCAVCGHVFYPSVAKSLDTCSPDCKKEWEGVMDYIADRIEEQLEKDRNDTPNDDQIHDREQ